MQVINLQLVVTPEIAEQLKALIPLASQESNPDKPEFITLQQAEEMTPYKYRTIRKCVVEDKLIPFERPGGPGGRIVIKRSDLEQLLSGKAKNGRSKPRATKRGPGRPRREPPTFA